MPAQGFAADGLTVFAAASLKEAMDEAATAWSGAASVPVAVSYAGSGTLARQVAQGAPADLVVLANAQWMDWLEDQPNPSLLRRHPLLSNHLVVVGPMGAPTIPQGDETALLARLVDGRLAIGQTQGVPAGIYGREWLEAAGLWPALNTRLAETENVRAALVLVARGEAPLGVVYASDADATRTVDVVYRVPDGMHAPIVYPLAVPDGKNAEQALEFARFLSSDPGQDIFERHGFVPLRAVQ